MNIKEWSAKVNNLDIFVKNAWDFEGNTEEEIVINGKQEHYYKGALISQENKARMGLSFSKEINGKIVTIQVGSAWHFLGVACKIFVDGKKVGGDRIVWFAK